MTTFTYEYDPTGTNPDNVVADPSHPLIPAQGTGYSLVVPKASSFFKKDFKLVHVTSNKTLTANVDYIFTHYVGDLSAGLNEEVYGSVTVVNPIYLGSVIPTYRAVGGIYSLDEASFAEYAIHLLESDGIYDWDKLANIPEEYDPEDHELSLENTAGYDELITAIKNISLAGMHQHEINNIRFLPAILNTKLDNAGNLKVLTDMNIHVTNAFTGSISVRLPKSTSACFVKTELQIVTEDNIYVFEVRGKVTAYNDGEVGVNWTNSDTTRDWTGAVELTYDEESYPCIVLGVGYDWMSHHVSILKHFAVDSALVNGETSAFRLTKEFS